MLRIASPLLALSALFQPLHPPVSGIQHLVVIIQENHSFDSYFGRYCKARTGSQPSCNEGPACCEAGPDHDPGTGVLPRTLDDAANFAFDPNHSQVCELFEMHGGKMDRYVGGARGCGDPRNFAYADEHSVGAYWKLVSQGALADRYFQPIAGASSSNDMYFARAQFVFNDNEVGPRSIGSTCGDVNPNRKTYNDPTIGDLLTEQGVSWAFYAEGYQNMIGALGRGECPKPDPACELGSTDYPCVYDASDNPFQYYQKSMDNPVTMRDFGAFNRDLSSGLLPAVSFIKAIGYKTEHPGVSNIRDGVQFVSEVLELIQSSTAASSTLILLTTDEGGGFFDHIAPPQPSLVDGKPYGTRVPMIATGPFARTGYVSHVEMEHSSIVRFIECNWLGGVTGQLQGRDATVSGIGSLIDPSKLPAAVPPCFR